MYKTSCEADDPSEGQDIPPLLWNLIPITCTYSYVSLDMYLTLEDLM
jgi:hypothetical protein